MDFECIDTNISICIYLSMYIYIYICICSVAFCCLTYIILVRFCGRLQNVLDKSRFYLLSNFSVQVI